jgi:asparagine synthase (glutamine-hydrolysing)
MCGIAGLLLGHEADAGELGRRGRAMAGSLRHRGPDDEGVWTEAAAGLVLAHRRLAVIDLSPRGAQPMESACGRWVIAYNGELYNWRELRAGLEAGGRRFRSDSDTEVLLELVARHGVEAALQRLDAMFALALWDRERRELWLARDHAGIKPLAWAMTPGGFRFGSEIQALEAAGGWMPEPDPGAIAAYLRQAVIPAPLSAFRGVRKLPPGGWLRVGPGMAVREGRWFDVLAEARAAEEAPLDVTAGEAAARVDAALSASVRAQLVADVPVGAFLSGAWTAAPSRPRWSVRRPGPTPSPSASATRATTRARRPPPSPAPSACGTPCCMRRRRRRWPSPPRWPPPGTSPSATPRPCPRCCSRGSRAGMSPWRSRAMAGTSSSRATGATASQPGSGRGRPACPSGAWPGGRSPRCRRGCGTACWAACRARRAGRARRCTRSASSSPPPDLDAAYARLTGVWDDPAALSGLATPDADPAALPRDPLVRMRALDLAGYLQDDVLTKVDRASMQVALEVRVPMLSPGMIRLGLSLPPGLLVREGMGKAPLRDALARHLPRPLFEREKAGFAPPLAAWLRGPLRPWAEEMVAVAAASGFVAPGPLRAAWAAHQAGRRDHAAGLWAVLMLAGWLSARRSAALHAA